MKRTSAATLDSITAPVGGWNARDSIASMAKEDAIIMDNWFPTPDDVMIRNGRVSHSTGLNNQVESLMPYNTKTGADTLFAAAGTSFFDVTATATASAVVSGLTNARWQSTNMTDLSGTAWLIAMNGVDNPRYWNGSAWVSVTNATSPAITSVTSSTLNSPWLSKGRLWALQTDSLKAWYFPAGAVGGTADAIDMAPFAKRGGYLVAGGSWTLDAGEGVDDYWVTVSSEGEVFVFNGTDPASSTTWGLVGIWQLGRPLGKRCFEKFAGDLLYLAEDGLWPLAKALISDRVDPRIALTDKINKVMNSSAQQYFSNFGWEVTFFPGGTMIIVNVPVQENSNQQQYASNSISKAWGKFTGWSANCFAVFEGALYYGGNKTVYRAWTGFADDDEDITADGKQAFNYFRYRGQKQFTMARPIFSTNGIPSILMSFNIDYDDNEPVGTLSFSPIAYGLWDTAVWDAGIWGGGLSVLRNWQSVTGIGLCAAPRLKATTNGIEVRWNATDVYYKPASIGALP
jgi:hypothetical protein